MVHEDMATERERLDAARAWAGWHLGDKSWGDSIVWAYKNPDSAMESIRVDKYLPVESEEA